MPLVRKLPDPLSAEHDLILADMVRHYDFNSGTARVQRVRTFRSSEREGSKTHAERDVDLVSCAIAMRPWAGILPRFLPFDPP